MRDNAIELMTAITNNIDGGPPSSTGKYKPDFDVNVLQEWLFSKDIASEIIRQDHPLKTKRPLAYLRAYLAICGDKIPAEGIKFSDGTAIYLDKGVMKALLLHSLVVLKDGYFELTFFGREALREAFDD